MTTTYVERTPTFEAIKWTGANRQAVVDALAGWWPWAHPVGAVDGGVLTLTGDWGGQFVLQTNDWLILGPLWGANTTSSQVLIQSNADFGLRFVLPGGLLGPLLQ